MNRIPVLDVEEIESLSENLGLCRRSQFPDVASHRRARPDAALTNSDGFGHRNTQIAFGAVCNQTSSGGASMSDHS